MGTIRLTESKVRSIVENATRRILQEVLLNRTSLTVPTERYGDIDIDVEIGKIGGEPMVTNWEFQNEDWVLRNVRNINGLHDEIDKWILDNEEMILNG